MNTVSANEARRNFAELLERAYYRDARIQVKRNNKAMAWIVGVPFMHTLDQLLEQIIKHDPSLADSLVLSMDKEIHQHVNASHSEAQTGDRLSLSSILDD